MIKDELSVEEIQNIEAFCKNEKMYNAVKKAVLAGLYSHGVVKAGFEHNPLENAAFGLAALAINNPIPDEMLGQHIRGMWAGVNALHNGFNGLSKIKMATKDEDEEEINEAI